MRSIRLVVAGVAAAVVAAGAGGVASAPPSGAQAQPLSVGGWGGALSYTGTVDVDGVPTTYDAHGTFNIQVDPDAVDGVWNLQVTSTFPGIGGTATANGEGSATGTGALVELPLAVVTVNEPSLGINIEFTADELPDPGIGTLIPTGGSCNAVTGEWSIPFGFGSLEGQFIAEPLRPGEIQSEQAALQDEGLFLIQQAREGIIDADELRAFIAKAEEQAGMLTMRRAGCDPDTALQFSNAATTLLDAVLVQSGYAAEAASDDEFMELYRVALRSGLLGFNDEARIVWEFELFQRIAGAVTTGERADWEFWLPVAREVGEESAERELARLICEDDGRDDCGDS